MPRSGTSLMMRMLESGGIPALTDRRRVADQHNPHGYFEDERSRRLAQDSSWIAEACGKAVKIIYRLLPLLPPRLDYRVLFMERNINEVYDSQQDMLESKGDSAATQDRDSIIRALSRDLVRTRQWLEKQPNVRCLAIPYVELVTAPESWVSGVSDFLDGGMDQRAMVAAVDLALYRHRSS